jgi:arginase
MPQRTIAVIGAPSSAGAYAPGQEKAPAAFRRHGLIGALEAAGLRVHDLGDLPSFRWRPDPVHPKSMNLHAVRDIARGVADAVASAMEEGFSALVLGGDCTVELGTVAGAQRDGSKVGLVYIDLDVDLNPPHESDGALDWTGVAHLLELPGTEPELAQLGTRRPMLESSEVLFFAADAITPGEAKTIRDRSLACIRLAQVQAEMKSSTDEVHRWSASFDRLLVHLDVDVLSYTDFPIAENVRRCPGLRFEELGCALETLLEAANWRALTIAEVNPDHAPDEAVAFQKLIGLIAKALQRNASARQAVDGGRAPTSP